MSMANDSEKQVLNEFLMEQVLSRENMQAAYLAVKANKGAAGIDGISTEDLGGHLRKHWPGIRSKLEEGRYRPAPVRYVEIPKSGGGARPLGIPCTVDRVIQQALHQQLDRIFDLGFSEHSYGFRRGRSAHDAVRAAQALIVEEGRNWVVDIDIKGFFDHINHDILMRQVSAKVKDKRVLKLIGRYLRSGILKNGKVTRSNTGTPQGGPLSPLLGNIYLDDLDKELESRGIAFCRYADDVTIYVRSQRSAERILESITKWIEKNLKLEISREKSGVRRPDQGHFLGFRIDEEGRIAMSKKAIRTLKQHVREHWDANRSNSGVQALRKWQRFIRGWTGYYQLSERDWDWKDLEGWMRRRMRNWFWLRWHNWKGRRNAFLRLGIKPSGRRMRLAHSSRGSWRIARALNSVMTNKWLRNHGFWVPSDLVQPYRV